MTKSLASIYAFEAHISKVARVLTDRGADREELAETIIPLINKLESCIRETKDSSYTLCDKDKIINISRKMNGLKSYLGRPATFVNIIRAKTHLGL